VAQKREVVENPVRFDYPHRCGKEVVVQERRLCSGGLVIEKLSERMRRRRK